MELLTVITLSSILSYNNFNKNYKKKKLQSGGEIYYSTKLKDIIDTYKVDYDIPSYKLKNGKGIYNIRPLSTIHSNIFNIS